MFLKGMKICCGSIIYNRTNVPIWVLEEDDIVLKDEPKVISKLLDCLCNVEYVHKVDTNKTC